MAIRCLKSWTAVKRVYGGEIDVRITGRRPGDAVASGELDLARKEFGWVPQLDDLERIVSDALSWERISSRPRTGRTEPRLDRLLFDLRLPTIPSGRSFLAAAVATGSVA